MWQSTSLGSRWLIALLVVACGSAGAGAVALYAPLRRRLQYREAAQQIPLSTYLRFDLSVRWRAFLLSLGGVSRGLTALPEVDTVAPGIIRILGRNPGRMTLQGTNTYLLGHGPRRMLIDSSDGNTAYVDAVQSVCKQHGVTEITHLLITHGHLDHIGGVLRLRELFPRVQIWKCMPSDGGDRGMQFTNAACASLLVQPLPLDKSFSIPETTLVLYTEYMPGHCADHVCFRVVDTSDASAVMLFSGDCILGEGSCVFDSLKDLMTSLRRLRTMAPRVIYPAHGPVVQDAVAKIDEYITHRQQREDEIVAALRDAAPVPLSTKQIVMTIYPKLPFLLQLAARKAVKKHLDKLLFEKRVVAATSSTWLRSASYEIVASNQ